MAQVLQSSPRIESTGLDLSASNNVYEGTWAFTLRDPSGALRLTTNGGADTSVDVSTTQPNECGASFGDNAWCAPWGTVNNPANGHWEIRLASTSAGDDRTAYGLRASGVRGGSPVELSVYSDSMISLGRNTVADQNVTVFPYVTGYCALRNRNVEFNDAGSVSLNALAAPAISSPPGALSVTQTNGALSSGDGWDSFASGNYNASNSVVRRGIWSSTVVIDSGPTTNYAAVYYKPPVGLGEDVNVGTDDPSLMDPTAYPTTNREDPSATNNAFRAYLPRTNGTAPVKPSLIKRVFFESGIANPPAVGQSATYRISVEFQNFTNEPISFGGGRAITINIPSITGGAVYGGSPLVTQGSVDGQPAIGGTGNVVWDPGVVAPGASPNLTYLVTLSRTVATPTLLRVTGEPTVTGNGTRAVFLDETGNASQARATYTYGPLCALSIDLANPATVPVTLAFVQASSGERGTLISWEAASEMGTLGYRIVTTEGGQQQLLSSNLIPATGQYSVQPQRYETSVPQTPSEFWIEEVDFSGKQTRYGPYQPNQSYGARSVLQPIDWAAARADVLANAVPRAPAQRNGASIAELRLDRAGTARVTHADLIGAGVDLTGVPLQELALSRNGAPSARWVESADALFGPGDSIEFVAEPMDTLHTKAAVYTVYRQASDVRTTGLLSVHPAAPNLAQTTQHTVTLDDNLEYAAASPTSDPWYLRSLTRNGANGASTTFSVATPERVAGESATLSLRLWGGLAYAQGDQDHSFTVQLNGQSLGSRRFDGLTGYQADFSVPAALLAAETQVVELSLVADTGLPTDRINVESVSVTYTRQLSGLSDSLTFSALQTENQVALETLFRDGVEGTAMPECLPSLDGESCRSYQINGLSGSAVIYRARGDQLWRIQPAQQSGSALYTVAEKLNDRYLVAEPAAVIRPAISVKPEISSDLLSGSASYLILAHGSLRSGLAPLVAARTADGYTVKVVDVADVFDAYTAGVFDPTAIRDYLRAAQTQLGTTHVLLVGGDTYDYFNYSNTGAFSLIPTLYQRTNEYVAYTPTDSALVDFNGDALPDMAIGRFPVRTLAELQNMVAKTLTYGGATHGGRAVHVSDRTLNGSTFALTSDTMVAALGANWPAVSDRIALDNYPANATGVAQARTALADSVNAGRALLNFVGHSSPSSWTFSSLLTATQTNAGLFTNTAAPTLVTQWGCYGSYFVVPQYNTISHALLLGPNGAAALLGSAALVEASDDAQIGPMVLQRLGAGQTLGESLRTAVRDAVGTDAERARVLSGMSVLGDPALRLKQ